MSAPGSSRGLLAVLAFTTTLLAGCVGPCHFQHSLSYRGRVVDTDTQAGVAGANVGLYSALTASTKSDAAGFFIVGPLTCSHFGIRVPPEGHAPQCDHSVGPNIALTISKAGYYPLETLVPATATNWTGELDVGVLKLRRETASQ
jgi:hypothetical protein